MAAFTTAVKALMIKNLRILFLRRFLVVFIAAFVIPITVGTILSFGEKLFSRTSVQGTSKPHEVKTLSQAFDTASSSGRDRLFLINNGHAGGDIDRVFDRFETAVSDTGADMSVIRLDNDGSLITECESSSRGVTTCFGAIAMSSSPDEGSDGVWNYTIQADASIAGASASVDKTDNPAQVYLLPVQRALDSIIATLENDESAPIDNTEEFPFTMYTQEEFNDMGMGQYEWIVSSILAIPFLLPMIIITFHLTGFIAGERESGMSQLTDSMSVTPQPWVSQAARILANYLTFVLVYSPGWIINSITLKVGLLDHCNFGIVFCLQFLGGLSFASWAVLFGSLFKKSQWSGISAFVVAVACGIVATMIYGLDETAVMVLSALFSPAGYTFFLRVLARNDADAKPTDLVKSAEMDTWSATPIAFIIFFVVQIFAYIVLGAFLERWIHSTASAGREVLSEAEASSTLGDAAVRLEGFSKVYKPGFWTRMCCRKRAKNVTAVENLDFTANKGQIVALLGANGSGKTTTLDSIGGLKKMTGGSIKINGKGGLGIAPQQNVLWPQLTVEEHLIIFDSLKSETPAPKEEIVELMTSIGLLPKRNALAKTLSGGQKRKLQLGMMLTGGSAVCCVDEVSSGIDPLSRRNIWDILIAERGRRTLIITTHFLDEADMLADHIAILSKGTLRAEGSSVELKDRLGGGYRVHVQKRTLSDEQIMPLVEGTEQKDTLDLVTYIAPSSELAAAVISKLEASGIKDYRFSNPTLEDVFLQLAEEIEDQEAFRTPNRVIELANEKDPDNEDAMSGSFTQQGAPLQLEDSRLISFIEQAKILFMKRLIVLKRNWVPTTVAFLLPTIVGCICLALAREMESPGCKFDSGYKFVTNALPDVFDSYSDIVIGPSSKFSNSTLDALTKPIIRNTRDDFYVSEGEAILGRINKTDTFEGFQDFINDNRENAGAGIWLGDDSTAPTFAWTAGGASAASLGAQNVLNMLRTNTSIATSLTFFETQVYPSNPNSIQLVIFTVLVMIAYPPLLALYPSNERRLLVRGMMYSNGVQPLALWLAYLLFDLIIVVASSVIITIVWSVGADTWYNVPYMLPVLIFYGLASVMLSHLISLAVRSQLATWALSVFFQVVFFAVYMGATVAVTEQTQPSLVDSRLNIVHFVMAIFAPIVSLLRALFVSTNLYKLACEGDKLGSNPGGITFYGGPILYLIVQSILLSAIVIGLESGFMGSVFRKIRGTGKEVSAESEDWTPEVADEIARMERTGVDENGLRITHLSKAFGNNLAVDDVSFGIKRGEVFALLGPNGAGKSTIISLVRGDIKPSHRGGDIAVEDYSVLSDLAAARTKLGVCPQSDALDIMTVREHLEFYAKIRGISNVTHNVSEILRAVGIEAFAGRLAQALSGGNKRKLSLAIALVGNPAVLLLDEPSSGLDAASKRIMWQTLASTIQGRSILLTTHSMEEADALAGRVGILSHRMLALNTPDTLRHRFGDVVHVHLMLASAPRTTPEELEGITSWIQSTFQTAGIEDKTYSGQIRFSVQGSDVLAVTNRSSGAVAEDDESAGRSAVGRLVVLLESIKAEYGIGHYSVVPTTLDQVFLSIVRAHSGEEENQYEVKLNAMSKLGRFIYS